MAKQRLRKSETTFLKAVTSHQYDKQRRVLDAIALKRRRPELSMTQAARQAGTTVKTVKKFAGSALQTRSGRLDAKATDRIARELNFFSDKGHLSVRVTNSRDATRVARHSNAVRKYVLYGDDSDLKRFDGKTLRASGKTYAFATDKAAINRLARAGAVSFMDIYSSVGGGS